MLKSVLKACLILIALLGGNGLAQASSDDKNHITHFGMDMRSTVGILFIEDQYSPGGIINEGLNIKALLMADRYKYGHIKGRHIMFALMPGWRFILSDLEINLFAGMDVNTTWLSPDDGANPMRGTHIGAHVDGEFWYQPNKYFMTDGAFSVSSLRNIYWGRLRMGWRLLDIAFVGPEYVVIGEKGYDQKRIGVHLTAIPLGLFNLNISGGVTMDNYDNNRPYMRLSTIIRF